MLAKKSSTKLMEIDSLLPGNETKRFSITADSAIIGLFVESLGANVTLNVYNIMGSNRTLVVSEVFSARTPEPAVFHLDDGFNEYEVELIHSGSTKLEVFVKATDLSPAEDILNTTTFLDSNEKVELRLKDIIETNKEIVRQLKILNIYMATFADADIRDYNDNY